LSTAGDAETRSDCFANGGKIVERELLDGDRKGVGWKPLLQEKFRF
jgi:hypothetical protein